MKSLWLKNYILNKPIFLYTILVDKLKHVISKVITKSMVQIFSTQTDILLILLLLYKMAFVNLTSRNICYFLIHTKVWFTKKLHSHHSELSLTYYTKFLCMQTPLDPSPSFDSRANKFQGGAWHGILSDIKIGWRIKCTYSRVGILPVQEKMNNHYVLFQNMKLSYMYRNSTFFPEQTMSLLSTKYIWSSSQFLLLIVFHALELICPQVKSRGGLRTEFEKRWTAMSWEKEEKESASITTRWCFLRSKFHSDSKNVKKCKK